MFLNEIKLGEKCKIKKIYTNEEIKRRLFDLGLIKDTIIECVLKSPFNEPKAYLIRNALIVIRDDDSKRIEVDLL